MKKKIQVIQQQDEPEVPVEIIAQSILEISTRWKQIRRSALNEKALIILLSHATQIAQCDIRKVLEGLDDLEKKYLKK